LFDKLSDYKLFKKYLTPWSKSYKSKQIPQDVSKYRNGTSDSKHCILQLNLNENTFHTLKFLSRSDAGRFIYYLMTP